MTTFLYFSYGSNMFSKRLKERCPSAELLQTIELSGYELKWHKKSKDGSAKCDIIKSSNPDTKVIGVCYKIDKNEEPDLDIAEGYKYGYDKKTINIQGRSYTYYYATDIDSGLKPYTWYKAFVIAGAKENNLPDEYIERLEEVEVEVEVEAI